MAKTKIKRLYLIPILSKALDVIELLEKASGPINLEDVYQQTRISRTSVYRILKTLVHRGYVAQNQSGEYRLVSRPRRLRFGFASQSADMPLLCRRHRQHPAGSRIRGCRIAHPR